MKKEQYVRSRQHREGVATRLKQIKASLEDLREAIDQLVAAQPKQHEPQQDQRR